MVVQHNIMALNAYNRLAANNSSVSKNLEKLSSGYKINRAGDDAAGLAISEKMRAQITGLERASDNAQDGISLVQTAEGALTEVHSMLNRMVELATQSSNGTFDNQTDRANLQSEIESLQSEIDRIAKETNFNGINLLDGSLGAAAAETVVTGEDKQATLALASAGAAKVSNVNLSAAKGVKQDNALELTITDNTGTKATGTSTETNGQTVKLDSATNSAALNGKKVVITVSSGATETTATVDNGDPDQINVVLKGDAITTDYGAAGTDAGTKVGDAVKAALRDLGGDWAGVELTIGANLTGVVTTSDTWTVTMGSGAADTKTVAISDGTNTYTKANVEGLANGDTVTVDGGANGSITFTLKDVAATAGVTLGTADVKAEATASTTTLDFTGKIGEAVYGSTVKIGEKTYEFVKAGGTAADGNEAIQLSKNATDAEIAGALKNAVGDVAGYTAALEDGKLTYTSTATGVDAEALEVKQTGTGLNLQIGDTASQRISVKVESRDSKTLGVDVSKVDISSETGATKSLQIIKDAINKVSSTRSDLGAIQNRLEYTVNNLATTTENLTSAEARIRDTDMAKEMMAYTKNNVLSQAAQAMLAQANQQPQQVLQLLQ